jgi:two-component system cell cycle sensor histidine kinase/response regulator CckA
MASVYPARALFSGGLERRWLPVAVIAAGTVSVVAACLLAGGLAAWPIALALLVGMGGGAATTRLLAAPAQASVPVTTDLTLLRAALEDDETAIAVTDRAGALVCVNPRYAERFDLAAPSAIVPEEIATTALRDGVADLAMPPWRLIVRRAGQGEGWLVWRFAPEAIAAEAAIDLSEIREQFGEAGVLMVVAAPDGKVRAANSAFSRRALGHVGDSIDSDLGDLLAMDEEGAVRFVREVEQGEAPVLRVVPVQRGDDRTVFLLLDADPAPGSAVRAGKAATNQLHDLLAMLPLGLALAERDGRMLFMNAAFQRAAAVQDGEAIVYPSDLVTDEDKATVIEAVRRFAQGRALPGDLAVRLKHKPEEPVALTIANAKGLGDAAVLLSLKDDSEQSALKRQVAQAIKMQAVGQLAGGVAHDFNNILTAIIGHCDLMAMRHTSGDSDCDDIQQIKNNSNRAAALTRQLLAFSRQQTLRPQILELPEVVSEVSNLLRRLLGETVTLEVRHGRNLGLIRADPGQLEQVIVNLAVNARDAMPEGGRLILQTYAVSADDIRRMRSDIMPIEDYTVLKLSDTGCGIPIEHLSKIFEPFFTTKEIGKGTGLGLSTVYGIVKQTGGFIFADSEVGHGTSFTLYLPVHRGAESSAPAPVAVEVQSGQEMWGTGTILLVEDEAMVRAIGERALTRAGYRVQVAANGEEALEWLAANGAVDLMVSDVVMPGLDGPTLVRNARALYPDLRILFMSGYAEEQLRESIDLDCVAFLSKPFSVQQLAQAVRTAMAGS